MIRGQLCIDDFITVETKEIYPKWQRYKRVSDEKEVDAYKCNDKDWYVIKSLEYDNYTMVHQKEFETMYKLV